MRYLLLLVLFTTQMWAAKPTQAQLDAAERKLYPAAWETYTNAKGAAMATYVLATHTIIDAEGFEAHSYGDIYQRSIGNGLRVGLTFVKNDKITKVESRSVVKALVVLIDGRLSKMEGYSVLKPLARAQLISMYFNCPKLVGPKCKKYMKAGNVDLLSREVNFGHKKGQNSDRRLAEANKIRLSYKLKALKTAY